MHTHHQQSTTVYMKTPNYNSRTVYMKWRMVYGVWCMVYGIHHTSLVLLFAAAVATLASFLYPYASLYLIYVSAG